MYIRRKWQIGNSKWQIVLWIFFFLFIGYFSYQRAVAFGCFDDCFNFVGAYFMLKGRHLYSQAFYNHQPLAAYISYIIQFSFHPKTIYQLVVEHRVIVFLFGLIFDVLLIKRFKKAGTLFILLYEPLKFYFFGERFLAENFIVYPLVFLFGLVLEQCRGQKISQKDLILASIFTCFVVFMREPFVFLALFLLFLLFWKKPFDRTRKISLFLFLFVSGLTLLTVPFKDYINQVWLLNVGTNQQIRSGFQIQSLLYPIYILIFGKNTLLHSILIVLDLVFLVSLGRLIRFGNWKTAVLIIFVLGLANLRPVEPGTQFYEAFHMVCWYALFVFSIGTMINDERLMINENLKRVLLALIIIFLAVPQSYIFDKVNREAEFVTGYGNYVSNGFVIKTLSSPSSTLFADRIDDLLYWVADLKPAYKYSWYFTGMPQVRQFSSAYDEMFAKYPPDFYLGFCPVSTHKALNLPPEQFENYVQVNFSGKPTCIYILNKVVQQLPKEKIEEIGKYQYSLASSK